MKLKKAFLIIPIMMIGIFVSAQSIRVDMDKRAKDDAFDKSQSILPVYRFEGREIEPYSKFGVDIDSTQPWYTIKKMPLMRNCVDTGYTYIYFAGADNAESQGYLLTMIGNYRRSRRTLYLFIDRNNDFDFTNDGAPDSIAWNEHSFEIDLENANVPNAKYAVKLTRFKYGENVRYKNLLTEHYKAHSGKKKFTNINYCFREQRYNCIQGNFNDGVDSFSIGIKDLNVNGVYNESCTDMLYVGPYKHRIASDKLVNIVPTISNNVFEWGNKKYRINGIETTGSYIEIEHDQNAKLSSKLEVGKKTPNFTYFNVLNKKHELKEYKKKEVFIFFWDKETLSNEDTAYLNKLHTEYSETLKIITLNHGDKPKDVKIMFYYDRIKWPVGFSNSDIASQYFLEDVSRGYYLGKKCILRDDNISPKELYQQLSLSNK